MPPNPSANSLPEPDQEEIAHSRVLVRLIREEIESQGPMPFQRFMELCLYQPGLGYYVAGSHKFGAAGDFVTAPELSPLFAACLAAQCAQVLEQLGEGDLLEAGAGSGALAAGLLRGLAAEGRLPRRYLILEISPELRARQRECLAREAPEHLERVHWLEAWPGDFTGVALANELLDALPVRRVGFDAQGVWEQGVLWREGFTATRLEPDPALRQWAAGLSRELGAAPAPGYATEFSPLLKPWVMSLGRRLQRGALLLIDYGYPRREYYDPERRDGTLLCHYRHRAHADPFWHPGLQDITASVDFTAVAEAGTGVGLDLEGFTTQGAFLIGCGLQRLAEQAMAGAAERQRWRLSQQIQRLTMPGDMGERFRVIGLSRGLHRPLAGFARLDLTRQL